jgi:hypothetical protein
LFIIAGFQVPAIPFKDVVGNKGAIVPLQNGAMALNVGIIVGLTVIFIVTVLLHCPALGVNKYAPEIVLFIVAGSQVPFIPLVEVVGKIGAVVPLQKGAIALKVGVTLLFTVEVIVAVVAHCPAVGVNK